MFRSLVVATAMLLTACRRNDVTDPAATALDATYAVESVNGIRLPAVAAEGGGQQYTLLADTLWFARDGRVARSFAYRHRSATFTPRDTVYRFRVTLPYTLKSGQLTIGYTTPCPPNANCVGNEEGTLAGSLLVVRARLYWSGEPVLLFRRLSGG